MENEINIITVVEEVIMLGIKAEANGQYNRKSSAPAADIILDKKKPPLINDVDLMYRYFQTKPDRFKDYELKVFEKTSNHRQDLEYISGWGFLVSEKFKAIFDIHNVPVKFFPVLSDGERRYIMMWVTAPLLGEYEVDVAHTKYKEDWLSAIIPPSIEGISRDSLVYSVGYLKKIGINTVFTRTPAGSPLCIRESLWREFDKQGIEYGGDKIKVSSYAPTETEMMEAKKTTTDYV